MIEHFRNILGIMLLQAFLVLAALFVASPTFGTPLFQNYISVDDWEAWSRTFLERAIATIVIALLLCSIWYALAQWMFKVDRWEKSDKRVVWATFAAFALLACMVAAYFSAQVQGGNLVFLFFVVVFLLGFWVATICFSPSSHKYAPLLAKAVRRW